MKIKDVLVVLLSFIFFISCSDSVKFTEKDIKKYPWMKTFVFDIHKFNCFENNLDKGKLLFSFQTQLSKKEYFEKVHDSATEQGWHLVDKSKELRIYKRPSQLFTLDNAFDYIELTYNSELSEITFTYLRKESRNKAIH